MSNRSAKFLLVETRLGSDLGAYLTDQRNQDVSFDRIARDLWLKTDVDITGQTVANWYAETEALAS